MKLHFCKLPGTILIKNEPYYDERGSFTTTYIRKNFNTFLGFKFVQDNISISKKGVIRGLHFQEKFPQGKLIQVISGKILDVVVDINPKSPTYGKYESVILSNYYTQFWIPPWYAHGFCVLSESATVLYKCTDYYYPEYEKGVIWNDPTINIKWPINNPILSEKDQNWPTLNELWNK